MLIITPLIDLLNDYNYQLKTQVNYVPMLISLKNKISMCILDNNLKAPPKELNELLRALNLLLYTDPAVLLKNTIL